MACPFWLSNAIKMQSLSRFLLASYIEVRATPMPAGDRDACNQNPIIGFENVFVDVFAAGEAAAREKRASSGAGMRGSSRAGGAALRGAE
jgi:hypothetical protein